MKLTALLFLILLSTISKFGNNIQGMVFLYSPGKTHRLLVVTCSMRFS